MRCEYHDLISDMLDQNQPAGAHEPEVEPYIFGLRPAARPADRPADRPAPPPPAAASAKSGDETFRRAVQRLELDLQEIESLLQELLLLRSTPRAKSDAPTQAK